ncbi:unnamed protein product, partial [Symbiodinium necroappetens]
ELKGLELDVHTEPGHALVDRVQAMLDSAQVLHIPPEKCISRQDEILGDKTEQKLSLGADGNIKITKQATSLRCGTTGELKLRRCYLRRALAFDQVGLASFGAMESWHNKMFQALLDAPPTGYRYTTVQQVLAGDQKLWQVVAQESRGDITIGVGLPAGAKGEEKGKHRGGKGKNGKGKDKTNADAGPSTSLKELLDSLPEGCVRATDEGRFICPFYNKGICRFQKRKSCRFGKHICNFKGCGAARAACAPEILAKKLLRQSDPIRAAQVADLFEALPHDVCDRVCNLFLLSDAVYTSFAIFSKVRTGDHRDSQNSFLPNYVIPLTSFEGGAIQVSEPGNEVVLDVSKGPVQFCARHYRHSTTPFRGQRKVLVLFSLSAASLTSAEDATPIGKSKHAFVGNPLVPLDLSKDGEVQALLRRDNDLCQALVTILFRAFESGALVSLLGHSAFKEWFFALQDQELDTCMYGAQFMDSSVPQKLCKTLCECATAACLGNGQHKLVPLVQVAPGADYKILSRAPGEIDGVHNTMEEHLSLASGPSVRADTRVGEIAGVDHTMEEHLSLASGLPSPADTSDRLPDQVRRNSFAILTEGPLAISRKRMLALQQLNSQLSELASSEQELRKGMHPDVEAVTKGKAIAVFRQLLEETNFPDMSVVDLLQEGVPLVGQEQESPLFAKRPKPRELEPEQLKSQAVLRRRLLMQMKGLTSEQDFAAMKAETAEEVASGFLQGPFHSEREVSELLQTEEWSLSPRFLLRQGEDSKIRKIDDFKMSAVNRAFGSSSFLELQDTDYAVGMLRFLSRVLQNQDLVRVPLSDDTILEGAWAPEMLNRPALLGKTLDLSKAYRQVAIHPSTREHAALGFPNPKGEWEFYVAKSLPFGAAASVYGFNKIALAVLHVMVLFAIATDFYDDYTMYEFKPAATLLDKVLMRLLDILGWAYAKTGRKFVPFGSKVVSLGVSLGLGELWEGILTVQNKPGRLERIAELLRAVVAGNDITRSDVASLHGLINFAGGLILGFELKPTSRMLSRALSGPFVGNSPELQQACALALDVLAQCRPKRCPASVKPPIILYTDGAYERGVAGWGAVLVDRLTGACWTFGGKVGDDLVSHWRAEAGMQVICQVEAYALAIVLFGIRGYVKGRSILAFIDNDPCALEALLWFERVPSKSNPADLPSKRHERLKSRGGL